MGTDTNGKNSSNLKKLNDTRAVMDSFRKIVRCLRNSSHNSQSLSGLTSAQFFILQQVSGNNEPTINEIADLTFTHQSTVSELVSRLIVLGLVSKKKSKRDGRKSVIYLTKKGESALKSSQPTAQEYLAKSIMALTPKKRTHLLTLLTDVVEHANFSNEKPTLFFES